MVCSTSVPPHNIDVDGIGSKQIRMKGDVPTPNGGNIHIEMTRKQIIIEGNGCGTGTLIVGKKRVNVEPNKRITIKYEK